MKRTVQTVQWLVLVVAFLGLSLWLTPNASAEEKPATHPCSTDVSQFCKDVQPGGGRIAGCLKQHESELTPECKAHIQASAKRWKDVHETCKDDVEKLCSGIKPGGGRIAKCLKTHENEVSQECKDSIAKARKK
ncbi:MAG: cysteine rich repeat-containing protein [Desulfobacteraceae bacterium]|nr:cysteine rich repeat-containing protein [Desulfobacteraceae bacterium]